MLEIQRTKMAEIDALLRHIVIILAFSTDSENDIRAIKHFADYPRGPAITKASGGCFLFKSS